MSFFRKKLSGLTMRLKCLRLGIVYTTSEKFRIPQRLWVGGAFRKLQFVNKSTNAFIYEFREICLNDCYRLKALKKRLKNIRSIVDIGANQGLFALAARKYFSKAGISAYEPNPHLQQLINFNGKALKAIIYPEAVMQQDGHASLQFSSSDLHTTASFSAGGTVTATSFRKVIERSGGTIDILKIDCEGGEWEFFEDIESWKHIKSVTMEYHLWARPGSNRKMVNDILENLGYTIISENPISPEFGLVTAVRQK